MGLICFFDARACGHKTMNGRGLGSKEKLVIYAELVLWPYSGRTVDVQWTYSGRTVDVHSGRAPNA